MGGGQALLWVIPGALAPLLLDTVPAGLPAACMLLAPLARVLPRPCRGLFLMLAAAAWTLAHVQWGLEGRYTGTAQTVRLQGRVSSLPLIREDLLEFRLRTDTAAAGIPRGSNVLVRWHRPGRWVHAGERWVLEGRLKPPRARVNFAGPDTERNLFAARISALAVLSGDRGHKLETRRVWPGLPAWRDRVRERLRTLLAEQPGAALILALTVADRGSLEPEFRRAMALTGTGHLLAISGLHVGMVALFGYALGRCLGGPLMARCGLSAIHLTALVLGLAAAAAYAGLAGFSTSTRRALIMLSVPLVCLLCRRGTSLWRGWLLAFALVLLATPLAPLQAGFWLSFSAVAVLIFLFGPRTLRRGPVKGLFTAQAGITLIMLPLGLSLFQQAAIGGLLTNLAAIPWTGFITLPLSLAGLALAGLNSGLAEPVLHMAARSAAWLELFLASAAALLEPLRWPAAAPGAGLLLCSTLGGLLLMTPSSAGMKLLGTGLYLAALFNTERTPDLQGAALEILDVGQGLAVLVHTREHLLLYDTGPGIPGRWDLHGAVLAPALARHGRLRPDRLVVSHGDLDHAGGLESLRRRHPDQGIVASLPPGRDSLPTCSAGIGWFWDGVQLQVLHPGIHLPYLGNDSSCVIAVRAGGASLLLPGDIGSLVERRLERSVPGAFDILVAPHHGSRTSTGSELLAWARPRLVLISAGADNRFGFPHPEVLERIDRAGAQAWSTASCGALRVEISARGGWTARSARRERSGLWRWPPAPECP